MAAREDQATDAQLLRQLIDGQLPDGRGRYGPFGGCYAPETLMPALRRLASASSDILDQASFQARLSTELADWVGRPTPLTPARGLGASWGAEV